MREVREMRELRELREVRGGIWGTLLLEGDDFDVFVGQTALPSL